MYVLYGRGLAYGVNGVEHAIQLPTHLTLFSGALKECTISDIMVIGTRALGEWPLAFRCSEEWPELVAVGTCSAH